MAPDQAGAEMRRLLPAAILLPCIIGWSLLQGQRQGWYGDELGLAMFTAANMLVFSGLVWWNSQAVRRGEQRRRDLEGRLADVLNSATDAIITIDEEQRIQLFNPAAEKIFGRSAREVIGQPLDLLLPDRYRRIQHLQEYAQTAAEHRRMGIVGDLHGRRANGEEFPIEASISQVESGGRQLMTVILRDVTERIRTENALRAHLRRVEAVAEMDRAILGMRSTHEVAETALITCVAWCLVAAPAWWCSTRPPARNACWRPRRAATPVTFRKPIRCSPTNRRSWVASAWVRPS